MSHLFTSSCHLSLSSDLTQWLDDHADGLDDGTTAASTLLPILGSSGLLHSGVPKEFGGPGGGIKEAVGAIAALSRHSLAAGLVLWGHRAYIECLLQSPNAALRDRTLPQLFAGEVAGASGLSNAMKFLSRLEELQIGAQSVEDSYVLNGKLAWATNLRPEGFHVAVAAKHLNGRSSFIASLASTDPGVHRSSDLDLIALRSTNTAGITISSASIHNEQILHFNAEEWLSGIRPAFLALQMGMSIGLAWKSIEETRRTTGSTRNLLNGPNSSLAEQISKLERELFTSLKSGKFHSNLRRLFEIRIALAEIVAQGISFELQVLGGAAYLNTYGRGLARRMREAAFIPIITPSLLQLRLSLLQQKSHSHKPAV